MKPFLDWCWRLMCLKETPSSLPNSKLFLSILFLVSLSLFTLSLKWQLSWSYSLMIASHSLVSQALLIYFILSVASRSGRFVKTLSAILMISLLFQFLALPILVILKMLSLGNVVILLLEVIVIFLQIWLLVIYTHILHCALDINRFASFLLIFGISMIQFKLLEFITTL